MESEDQSAREARIRKLWRRLDTKNEGKLDANGLKKGLQEIDHPLQNADTLLQDVLRAIDNDGDRYIQYTAGSEFRTFVEQTEKELAHLFKSIDRDQNGQLDKNELKDAFVRAGLIIPSSKLDQFFAEVDTNHDGVISFDEWRNFLLFIPANIPNLKAVLSYYSSTVTINAEGDVHISDETIEGLGTPTFLRIPFGALINLFRPYAARTQSQTIPFKPIPVTAAGSEMDPERRRQWDPGDTLPAIMPNELGYDQSPPQALTTLNASRRGDTIIVDKPKSLTPPFSSGYFVAGGVAGVVSRTATAPLDRLKVYLIAQVGKKDEAVQAAKSGAPVQAVKHASRPLVDAVKQLWRMGGMRSLFAGNGLNVVKVMPESAIKFGSYEGAKRMLAKLEGHDNPRNLAPWSQFFAAGMGGIISQFCIYPLDTLKFRMQCETVEGGLHGNALISDTAIKMWKKTGIRSFYRGLPFGLVGMFPYSAIDLTTFEYSKRFFVNRNARIHNCDPSSPEAAPGNFTTAGIGAFSGAFGASVVYPINLLRTRLQSQGTAIHPPTYTGIVDVTVKTIRGEGYRGLFKGITPNLLKVVPAVSITYVVYDNCRRVLGLP